MADNNIRTRIQLDGGADVKKQIDDIAGSTEKIGSSAEFSEAQFKKLSSTIRTASAIGTFVGTTLAKTFEKLSGIVANAGESFSKLSDNADHLGISIQRMQGLETVAARAGISVDKLVGAFDAVKGAAKDSGADILGLTREQNKYLDSLGNVTTGVLGLTKTISSTGKVSWDLYGRSISGTELAFARMGIRLTDAGGSVRDQKVVISELADVLRRIPDSAMRASIALTAFPESIGGPALKLANSNVRDLTRSLDEASASSSNLTRGQAQGLDNYNTALGRLGDAWDKLAIKIGGALAGPAAKAIDWFASKLERWPPIIDMIKARFSSAFASIRAYIQPAIDAVSAFIDKASQAAFGGGAQKHAAGGYISGPGTGTSDSIPAWLSNGEYVIRAGAVSKYGVGLLNAINGMSLAPSSRGGRFGFADGGFVGNLSGGAGKSFTLNIDGNSFGGLSGSDGTMKSLERYAITRQFSATSKRAPSRVG